MGEGMSDFQSLWEFAAGIKIGHSNIEDIVKHIVLYNNKDLQQYTIEKVQQFIDKHSEQHDHHCQYEENRGFNQHDMSQEFKCELSYDEPTLNPRNPSDNSTADVALDAKFSLSDSHDHAIAKIHMHYCMKSHSADLGIDVYSRKHSNVSIHSVAHLDAHFDNLSSIQHIHL